MNKVNKSENNLDSKELSQFFTKKHVAENCFNFMTKKIYSFKNFFYLEPSAGEGAFSEILIKKSLKNYSIDIEPRKSYIKKGDFLNEIFNFKDENIITIGNPPFGKNSSTAIKFFNKAANFSKYICMIFPKTFRKTSIINRLDPKFHLFYELEIKNDSFLFNNKNYSVPCVFQIWKKKKNFRKKIETKNTSTLFKFTSKSEGDIAIRRVGVLAGKIFFNFEKYKSESHYFIKFDDLEIKKRIFEILFSSFSELNSVSKNTAGNPSLSKNELIKIIEKNYNLKNF